ncbi:hypothetical protein J6590_019681 [Homalodisca vitripennis]|nr:hypothetical protein J6590_019681 [Homalodisca vitripennis]
MEGPGLCVRVSTSHPVIYSPVAIDTAGSEMISVLRQPHPFCTQPYDLLPGKSPHYVIPPLQETRNEKK